MDKVKKGEIIKTQALYHIILYEVICLLKVLSPTHLFCFALFFSLFFFYSNSMAVLLELRLIKQFSELFTIASNERKFFHSPSVL